MGAELRGNQTITHVETHARKVEKLQAAAETLCRTYSKVKVRLYLEAEPTSQITVCKRENQNSHTDQKPANTDRGTTHCVDSGLEPVSTTEAVCRTKLMLIQVNQQQSPDVSRTC